jgi:UDP-glucose:(heptosyl)LPS alpha-1,3-glucosyltransferase
MRIAFAIVKLFPGGGLQRDCVEIARAIARCGHEVAILTAERQAGDFAGDLDVAVLPARGRTNHRRQEAFSAAVAAAKGDYDLMVGFNKLAGLDVLYCADAPVDRRLTRAPWLALLPRYRTFRRLEGESFRPGGETRILLLSGTQLGEYSGAWKTEPGRLVLLPPAMTPARRKPGHRTDGVREAMRDALGLGAADWAWLSVCVQPRTKGLDRAVAALRDHPAARLVVAGLAETDPAAAKLAGLARRLGVASRIGWLGHREDMAQVMAAADLLVHPARYDTTGTVILEAIINGLPVVTTAACGYAEHVAAAPAGIVLEEPFAMAGFQAALATAADRERCRSWSACGAQYGARDDLYQGRTRAAEIIIDTALAKARAGTGVPPRTS